MKKLLALTVACVMVITFASISMASTMGVNVSKGNSICFEKDPIDTNPLYVTGNFGVSDKLLLSFGTTFNDANDDSYTFGGRYEIMNNLATGFKFEDGDTETFTIDLRYKYDVDKKLALVGKLAYTDPKDGDDIYGVTAQAEYSVADNFIPTFALAYSDTDSSDSITRATLGMDFYPTDKFFIYLDYTVNVDDSDDDSFYLGLEFAL